MDKKEGKPDQSGWHLIVLAKNEKGYHNLIKLVSRAWTEGYYIRIVGLNEDKIKKYIQDQEKHDIAMDKLSVKEYEDPFKG